MSSDRSLRRVRVLYSFPHRIGAGRICTTAWEQVRGSTAAGADLVVHPGAVARPLPDTVDVRPTLARGKVRLPYRALGRMRALTLHDRIVARRLPLVAERVDVVHAWPSAAVETLRAAKELGLPTVLERPNAHTRFAYEVVQRECDRVGVSLPPSHEHAFNPAVLEREEEEFLLADRLLCPSDFVEQTFLDAGFPPDKLVRHAYGFDQAVFHPSSRPRDPARPFTAIFVGVAAVRKGLHFALEAWLRSRAARDGKLLIAGELLPAYERKLGSMLAHPSVSVLGARRDVADLLRQSDVFVLPSIEEGSPLASLEAIGCGCVPVVSTVCEGPCRHGETALVHDVGDVETLSDHLTQLYEQPSLREELRENALRASVEWTWDAAGDRLAAVYREVGGFAPRRSAGQLPTGEGSNADCVTRASFRPLYSSGQSRSMLRKR